MLSLGKGEPPVDPSEGEKQLQRLKGSFSNTRRNGGGKLCAAYPGTNEQTSPKEERERVRERNQGGTLEWVSQGGALDAG